MKEMITNSVFFGTFLTLMAYQIGLLLKRRWKSALCNPLLLGIIIVMVVLFSLKIDYDVYYEGAKYISYFLTPATVALAIPLYQRIALLKEYKKAIMIGILSGVLTSLTSVFFLAMLFGLNHAQYVTLLPKSITTAIGMGISEELGGIVTITVVVISITGIFGNIVAQQVLKWFHIEEKVAIGIAIGTSSHAMGTTKAMELGEIEGAMSSLSIAVAGIITVVGASIYANFL